jgi:hypothetical protein
MSFSFKFELPEREGHPGWIGAITDNTEGLKARHHILGRKYLQLLFALALAVDDVRPNDLSTIAGKDLFGFLLEFAGWTGNDVGAIKRSEQRFGEAEFNNLRRSFFWSPYNLFIGPIAQLRIFDPSSGVEQDCPRNFPLNRWDALKAIPVYLHEIGVNLQELVDLRDGGTKTWTLTADKGEIRERLRLLIKNVVRTMNAPPEVYEFNEADWVATTGSVSVQRHIQRCWSVSDLYQFVQENSLLAADASWTWVKTQSASVRSAYKFILIPRAD